MQAPGLSAAVEGRPATWWSRPAGGRELLVLAMPLVMSMISWTLMHFTDRMFLMWYSTASVAASMPASAIFWLAICLPLGACQYVNTFVSQYHGAGRPSRIGRAVWQGVWLALLAWPLILATIPAAPSVLNWLAQPANAEQHEVLRQEIAYYRILCWSGGAMLLAAAWSSFYTGRGMTRVVMFVDFAAAAVNVVLDYFWIFGVAGFPAWGIEGAAWATVVSLWLRPVIYLLLFLRAGNRRQFGTLSGCRIDGGLLARLLRYGIPSGVQMTLEVAGFTVFLFLVGRLGEVPLAATNLALNVSQVAFMPAWGLSMAVSIMVGQRLGENRDDLAARATWTGLAMAEGYMALLSVLFVTVPGLFMFGFHFDGDVSRSDALRALTVVLLVYVAAYNVFDALNMVFVCALKGAGDTLFVMGQSLFMSASLVLGCHIALKWFEAGVHGIWLVATAWICLLGVIYLLRFLQGSWRKMRVIEPVLTDEEVAPPDEEVVETGELAVEGEAMAPSTL
ncbi:MAG: MATE family efflux transporter [Planctomycetia bacterium]|nr:MATE family efflux transporter [Planctomycetia bacterium]